MKFARLMRISTAAGLVAFCATSVQAQTAGDDPHHTGAPGAVLAQAPAQATQPAQPGMMRPGMMGMMGDMMRPGAMGAMPMMAASSYMTKVMFAIVDANGDGALSFDEVTAIHKRIFDAMDANKDGKVTIEEFRTFMRE